MRTDLKTIVLSVVLSVISLSAFAQNDDEATSVMNIASKLTFHSSIGLNYVGSNNLSPFGLNTKEAFNPPGFMLNEQFMYHYKTNRAVGLDLIYDQHSGVLSDHNLLAKPSRLFVGLSLGRYYRKTLNYIFFHSASLGFVYNGIGYRSLDSDQWNSISAYGFGYVQKCSISRRLSSRSWIGLQAGFMYSGTFKWHGDPVMINPHSYNSVFLDSNGYNSTLMPFIGIVTSLM